MIINILGTRGSMPTGGDNYIKYGSDTSSYLVLSNENAVFLDAGSGICHAPDLGNRRISIILSHLHLDHIMGLPFASFLSSDTEVDIYSELPGKKLENTLNRVFSPPFWPCTLSEYKARITYKEISDKTDLGDICIYSCDGNHPGGCKLLRIEEANHSITYATDYECDSNDQRLISLAKNSDYLIIDGQYTEDEYDRFKGFGHSTKEAGIYIAKQAQAKHLLFTHHDPRHNDDFLSNEELKIQKLFCNASLARQGGIIKL